MLRGIDDIKKNAIKRLYGLSKLFSYSSEYQSVLIFLTILDIMTAKSFIACNVNNGKKIDGIQKNLHTFSEPKIKTNRNMNNLQII